MHPAMAVEGAQAPRDAIDGPRTKRVLAFEYSQSGQLSSILERILAPLRDTPGIEVHVEPIVPERGFPFPWSIRHFFDAFPESALLVPEPLRPLSLRGDESFDLVILPYQVWFLAPALPVSSLLQDSKVQALLKGRPVVTVIGCRNMWLMAQASVRRLLQAAGARLLDNVVLTDRAPMAATLVTTPLWMFTGRRDGWFGLPAAGVSSHDVQRCQRFGFALRDALLHDREQGSLPLLQGLQAVQANPRLWVSERAGTRSFRLWGRLIRLAGPRGSVARVPLLMLYVLVLIALIVTVLPLSTLVQAALRPLRSQQEAAQRLAFESPSGSGAERMALYDR